MEFYEAATIFAGRYLERPDLEHSGYEERFQAIGFSTEANLLFVCYCERKSETVIRLISARLATKREYTLYDKKMFY